MPDQFATPGIWLVQAQMTGGAFSRRVSIATAKKLCLALWRRGCTGDRTAGPPVVWTLETKDQNLFTIQDGGTTWGVSHALVEVQNLVSHA